MKQMETYFNGLSWHEISADTSGVISDMMEILRKNQARLFPTNVPASSKIARTPDLRCLPLRSGQLSTRCYAESGLSLMREWSLALCLQRSHHTAHFCSRLQRAMRRLH